MRANLDSNENFAFCSVIFVPYATVRDILHAQPIIFCSTIFQNKTLSSRNKPAIRYILMVPTFFYNSMPNLINLVL